MTRSGSVTNPKLQILQGRIYELAKHEAAHLVIARALGFNTGYVKVVCDAEGHARGEAQLDLEPDLRAPGAVSEYLCKRLCVLYAGVTSETVLMGEVRHELADENLDTLSSDDRSKIRELQRVLAGIARQDGEDFPTAYKRVEEKVRARTAALVVHYDTLIERLADTLRAEIRAPDEPALVDEWNEPELGAALKSHLRGRPEDEK